MGQGGKNFLLPSSKAEEIIKNLQIREPAEIQVRDIAMERGAFVRERLLEGSEARLVRKGSLGIITVNSGISVEGQKRFAIAHELGHFELHTASQLILCTEQDMYVWNENKAQEIEANEFAANILMPEEIFRRYIKPGRPNLDTVKELSSEFRTTLTATALRYVQLSIEPCAVAVSKDGVIKWYKKSTSFNFHVKVGEKLSLSTYASDFYDGVNMPPQPQKAPAYAWLAGDFDEDAEIFEHSTALASYGVVISLLWVCDEIRSPSRMHDDYDEEPKFDLTNPFTPDGKRWRW
jgi:Zn-dependent peptidase ImmA (M78 family)